MKFLTNKLKLNSIIILLAACLFSSCAIQEGGKRASVLDVFGITEENRDKNTKEIVFKDDGGWERKADDFSESESKTTASDGSQITMSKDASGNVTYNRTFRNDPRLESIMVIKSPDGGQIIYLYGKGNGKVVRLTDETAENGLEMSAADLADRAKLIQPIETNSYDEPKISSSLPVKNAPVPNQNQQNYFEDYNDNFPQITENNSQTPEQTKVENPEENQTKPQIADNE